MIRRLSVGVIAVVITAPLASLGFAMGLMVAEPVIYPTVALLTALIAALVASWLADGLAGDGERTDLNEVIRHNLVWAILPALAALASPWLGQLILPPVFLLGAIVIWTATTATRFAFRYRLTGTSVTSRLARSGAWLFGAALATVATIFVASLFGLTGT
jgi:hypothetical protein